ncbi:MAG: NAD(+) synthase [Tissierellia bacterium]|nr:NAD(+) synthase [Tissierellia bacterium]
MNANKTMNNLINWLETKAKEANAKGFVFGLSGGIDSAIIAGLSKKVFPDTSLGIIMPIDSIREDEEDALLVAKALNLETKKIDLTNVFNLYKETVDADFGLALSNVKPRLRTMTLYYFAQNNNYLVLGSSNLSEFNVGYFTKFGDSACDLMPLASFYKSEIYELARELNIPKKIIDKAPSAGLWEGQTDENEMGVSYDEIEAYFKGLDISEESRKKIERMHKITEHKRKFPPIFNEKE